MDQLDRRTSADRLLTSRFAGTEQDQHRAQSLPPRLKGRRRIGGKRLTISGSVLAQHLLDLAQALWQPAARGIEDGGYRRWYGRVTSHSAVGTTPLWIAKIPPAMSSQWICSKPALSIFAAREGGSGKL